MPWGETSRCPCPNSLDPRRHDVPIERRRRHPFAAVVARQVTPVLQAVQHLHSEKRMACRLPVEGVAEGAVESIGFDVDQGIDEGAAVGLIQPDLNVAERTLQLVEQRLQGMAFAAAPQRNLSRPIDAYQQDPFSGQAATQVEEQVDRAKVDPLHIVDD
jgi:hypothetical protein